MNIKKIKRVFYFILSLGILLFLFVFLVTCTLIGHGVRERCQEAQTKYTGECVEALIETLNDESNPFAERNSATWALGQLGDKKALETLKKHYTENPKDHEPWNEVLSQYELSKAIKLIESDFNISAWVWR
jgi:hypothetical protein